MFLFDEQYLVCRGESISSLSNISINKKPVFVSYVAQYENSLKFVFCACPVATLILGKTNDIVLMQGG